MSDATLLLGRRVAGKYVLEAHVGGGAMGEVYRARHLTLGAPIAIKIMRADIARDPEFRERFLREAKATSRLEHPNSVRVVDYGEDPDGLVYLAMEFLAGRDLLAVLREDWPLSDARIVDILAQTLAAVGVAHGLGIIHRDLKPENIMVLESRDEDVPRDIVKVCDFGIAKLTDPRAFRTDADGSALTSSGAVVGTPEYMSPEQARGDALDARSDIYSVGIILYQMLTGRVPFTAGNALGVVLKQVIDIPTAPSAVRAGINPRLEAVCLRAIAKSPDARYATAKEMRAELRAALGSSAQMFAATESDPSLRAIESDPALPSRPDFASKPSTGGAEIEVPITKPSPIAIALAAVLGLVALGAVAFAAVSFGQRGVDANATSAASSPLALAVPTTSPEGPATSVPPLPTSTSRSRAPALASAARPAPSASTKPPIVAPSASASAAPPITSAAAPPSAAPAVTTAAPYNASGAFVGLGAVNAERVRPESVSSLLRAATPALTECYQLALRIVAAPVGGRVELTLAFDEQGRVTAAIANEPRLPSFGRCVQNALAGRKVGAVEGAATATQWLDLHP